MLQWFIRFPEFTKFNESSAPFRKNSIEQEMVKTECTQVLSASILVIKLLKRFKSSLSLRVSIEIIIDQIDENNTTFFYSITNATFLLVPIFTQKAIDFIYICVLSSWHVVWIMISSLKIVPEYTFYQSITSARNIRQ